MKTRTKLLTAVLSTVTALSCALTAAAAGTTPTITLQGNETKPAAVSATNETATLTLSVSNFSNVAGADLEITLMNGNAVPTGITVSGVNANGISLTENSNYVLNRNKLKIVDVFNMDNTTTESFTIEITFTLTSDANIGRYDFSTSKIRFVDKDENDIINGTASDINATLGKLVVGKKTETVTGKGLKSYDDTMQFLPYGVLTDSNGKYLDKDVDAKFNFTDEKEIRRYIKPLNNDVTTFGASKIVETQAIQFGSYVEDIANGATFGTLVIAPYDLPDSTNYTGCEKGSYDDVVNYYKDKYSETYDTTDKVLAHLVELLINNNKADGKFYPLKYDTNKIIFLSVVKQNNYMWKNAETNNTKLQYAVRYKNLNDAQQVTNYTAVGYYCVTDGINNTYDFSTEIKTAQYSTLGQNQ